MPAYVVGRWRVEVDDQAGETVSVLESGALRETLAAADFEARGEGRPSYVPTNQLATFLVIVRRVLHNLQDRRRPVRSF